MYENASTLENKSIWLDYLFKFERNWNMSGRTIFVNSESWRIYWLQLKSMARRIFVFNHFKMLGWWVTSCSTGSRSILHVTGSPHIGLDAYLRGNKVGFGCLYGGWSQGKELRSTFKLLSSLKAAIDGAGSCRRRALVVGGPLRDCGGQPRQLG